MKQFQAIAILAGTIVGAGLFALPYAAFQSGFFAALAWLSILSVSLVVLYLMLTEVILRTRERHRIGGYAEHYIGAWARIPLLATEAISLTGTLLAYVILSGTFLSVLFPAIASPLHFGLLAWLILTVPVILGIRTIARLEFIMSCVLGLLVLAVSAYILSDFTFTSFPAMPMNGFAALFFPFGVTLFALLGTNAVYEVRDLLAGEERKIKKAIVAGTIIPAVLYAIFIFAILGGGNGAPSSEAISGLVDRFGTPLAVLGSLVGLFAVATSYFTIARYVVDELRLDLHIARVPSFSLLLVPPLLYAIGATNFVVLVSGLGTLVGIIVGPLIIAMWKRSKTNGTRRPEFSLSLPDPLVFAILVLFVLGGIISFASLL